MRQGNAWMIERTKLECHACDGSRAARRRGDRKTGVVLACLITGVVAGQALSYQPGDWRDTDDQMGLVVSNETARTQKTWQEVIFEARVEGDAAAVEAVYVNIQEIVVDPAMAALGPANGGFSERPTSRDLESQLPDESSASSVRSVRALRPGSFEMSYDGETQSFKASFDPMTDRCYVHYEIMAFDNAGHVSHSDQNPVWRGSFVYTLRLVDGAADPGKEFWARPGRAVIIAGTDLTIRFEEVLADTRCPRDMECFWEGNAEVRLTARRGESSNRETEVVLNMGLEPGAIRLGSYKLTLVSLNPAREQSGAAIPQEAYVAGFIIEAP